MLKKEDFVYFGKLTKPHGTRGEIGICGDGIVLGDDCDFVACEIDGILVPFFLESCRGKNSDTIIVKFEDIDSAESVRFLTNCQVYIPREWIEESEDNYTWKYFIGFTAEDETAGTLGEIIDVDENTINTLFVVDYDGDEVLIPANEELIKDIDHSQRTIYFDLPEGLIEQ